MVTYIRVLLSGLSSMLVERDAILDRRISRVRFVRSGQRLFAKLVALLDCDLKSIKIVARSVPIATMVAQTDV